MQRKRIGGKLLIAGLAALPLVASSAQAAAPHVVAPGETLWSISAANNLTTRTVAAFNGLPEDAQLLAGETIQVPTVAEGAAALASNPGYGAAATSTADEHERRRRRRAWRRSGRPTGPFTWQATAAEGWNAMRQESLRLYGVGPLSGRDAFGLPHLRAAGLSVRPVPLRPGRARQPTGDLVARDGTAVDVATPEMRWVIDQIGANYGWGKLHAPGEWWHVDYLG